MSPDEFQETIDKTIKELPEEFLRAKENVEVVMEDWPTPQDMQTARVDFQSLLFGLYRGVPKTKRGNYYSAVLPDKIVIFTGPILMVSKNLEDAKDRIKKTVLHEIGHHFGLSDKQIYAAQGH